MLQGFIKKA